MRNECNIIKDILPLYIEGMVSDDTVSFVEEHIKECTDCRAELEAMKRPTNLEKMISVEANNDVENFHNFKRVWKKKNRILVGKISAITIICILFVGIIVFSLLIADIRKSYKLPFEREELDSISMLYVSSSVVTDTYTFDNKEECALILDFFDSLEITSKTYEDSTDDVSASAITFHLSDGTEEKVTIINDGGKYTILYGEDESVVMSSNLKLDKRMKLNDTFFEKISVQILVDGTIYYWDRLEAPSKDYSEYGEILETVNGIPTKDCQMMARYEATGTIYTCETKPDAVYVEMSIDGTTKCYVRFVSSEILAAGYSIFWNGTHYDGETFYDVKSKVRELPNTCEYIGNLHYIGDDVIPENDLETNCPGDSYGYNLEGREVYFDSNDPDYIYVYQKRYWAEGEYDTYIKLPALQ